MRIALTGSSGKLGTVVARELRANGYDVIGMDIAGTRGPSFVQVDLSDYGQVIDALGGVGDRHDAIDAIVHLGAIPAPGIRSDVATFHNNMNATFNVFWAGVRLGIRRIVYASSETVLGLPFDVPPPYIPVDEEYPARPESVYSLVKTLEEGMATELVRWHPDLSITALRFSNVMTPRTMRTSPRSTTTRCSANGTCGATSTPATALRLCSAHSRSPLPDSTGSSSRQPTPSCRARMPS